ncbi:MAG: hypothetical protein ACRDQ5_16245 [Sciscionella sp.]
MNRLEVKDLPPPRATDPLAVDVPDTPPVTPEKFDYAGSGEHRSAAAGVVVALTECGTHAFCAAELEPWAVGRPR